jgi:hypothetical protein
MEFTIVYQGQGISWNDIYANSGKNAWKIRKSLVDKYKKIFTILILEAKLPWMDEYEVALFYNSRHDLDNCGAMSKILVDVLKQKREGGIVTQRGWVYDDSKKYYKKLTIAPDESLENNTFKFIIKKLK